MSIRNTVNKYLNNHAETNEFHWDPSLKTNYFKTTKDQGMVVLEDMFHQAREYEIHSVSKEHGEMSVHHITGKKAFIVVSVIMVRPYRTAIDFSVTTESVIPFDFGYSTRLIQELYNMIRKKLPIIIEDSSRQ
ncbi:cytosolic protein [Virgibacillus xinjiangensis]|uniref:Cytosolic protein n=1 Tax=Virgibacillus xinjiangensis TaxID=393090 RepID=A0ABV7CUP6_9BACI